MDFLRFEIDSCKDCYSCLRNCPTKSIKFINNKAEIIYDTCVLCGHCVNVCPQNAKRVISDVENVRELIKKYPGKVALSVAPSFISNFPVKSFKSFKDVALKMGFAKVEETAIGAFYVTREYERLIRSKKYKTLITTCCPAAVKYVCQNYPDAVKYLAPVVSPMVAHAKIIKHDNGDDFHVVFVGPCIAKKKEAYESKEVDFALTFEEFEKMRIEDNLSFPNFEDLEESDNRARFYPITRGIIKSFSHGDTPEFDSITVDGVSDIMDVLGDFEELNDVFLEMNMCRGGCINGPCKLSKNSATKDNTVVRNYVKKERGEKIAEKPYDDIDFSYEYKPIKNPLKIPSEAEIQKILNHIFIYKKEDEINCGACGYKTCRDKAIAVYNNIADAEFCMPYLKNRAESISNEIIKHTPNAIITINKYGVIVDANESAFQFLKTDKRCVGHFYQEYVTLPELLEALEKGENVKSVTVYLDQTQMYCDVSITVVKEHGLAFAIFKDKTEVTLSEEKMRALRNEMVTVTDSVINKQMMAVQEIASLLGESTAEAKAALVKFKNSLKEEE